MKRLRTHIAFALVLTTLLATPALAYKAEVGNRAANFKGFDIVNREVVELDDYFGQWVFVEFWATWCGPCMRELPNMLAETRPYVDSGQLKVITVNGDYGEPQTYETLDGPLTVPPSLPKLREAIRKLNIQCPVIYDGGAYDEESRNPIQATEWGVRGWPSSFLINPQGVIVATELRGEKLEATLDFYINGDRPLMGLFTYLKVHDDGSTSIYANVRNTGREDVEVGLYTYEERFIWDEELGKYEDVIRFANDLTESAIVGFDDFCEARHEFILPADEDLSYFTYYIKVTVPGSEHIGDAEDHGIKLDQRGGEHIFYDVELGDGEFIVHR